MYTTNPPEWECIHPKEMFTGPSSRRGAIVTHQGILLPPPPHYPHRDVFYVLTLCSSSLARADVILVRRLDTPPAIDTAVQQSSDPFRHATVYCMIPSRGLAVVEVPVHGNDGSSVTPRRPPFSSLVTVVVPPRTQLVAPVGDTTHMPIIRSVVQHHEPTTQFYTLTLLDKHDPLQPGTPWYIMKQQHEPRGSAVDIATPVALATFGHGFSDAAVPLQWDDALFHRMFGCACHTVLNHHDVVWRRDDCGECGHHTTPPRHDSTRTLASCVFLPRVDTSFPFLIIMGIVFSPLLRNHATHPVTAEAYAHMCNDTKKSNRTQCIIVTHVTKCTQKEVRRYSVSSCLEAGTVVTHVNHRPVTSLDGVMAAFHSPVTSERDGALLVTFRTVLGSTFVISVADALSIEHACCQSSSSGGGYRSVRSLKLVKVLEQFRRPDQGMPPLPLVPHRQTSSS